MVDCLSNLTLKIFNVKILVKINKKKEIFYAKSVLKKKAKYDKILELWG